MVDFDVHHGNGTEEIARAWHAKHRKAGARAASGADDSDLFFASIHLADDGAASSIEFYPGTGTRDDLHHNIVNVCVPPMWTCLLYTSPSPRDGLLSRMPSSA